MGDGDDASASVNASINRDLRSALLSDEQPAKPPSSMRGVAILLAAMVINASNSAAFKFVQGQAPDIVTSCNVLCSTNMIGLVTLPILFRRDLTLAKVRAIRVGQWLALLVGTLLFQVIGPFFFLKGLGTTSVSQAAILARLDQVEFYVFSLACLGEQCNGWDGAANLLTLVAVVIAIVISPAFGQPLSLDASSIYIIVSTFGYSGSLLVSKRYLTSVPVGIVGVFRLLVGTLSFHAYTITMGGGDGFINLYDARLWVHMWWYGLYALGSLTPNLRMYVCLHLVIPRANTSGYRVAPEQPLRHAVSGVVAQRSEQRAAASHQPRQRHALPDDAGIWCDH